MAKDISAGAVMISAFASIIVGFLLFVGKFFLPPRKILPTSSENSSDPLCQFFTPSRPYAPHLSSSERFSRALRTLEYKSGTSPRSRPSRSRTLWRSVRPA